MYIALYKVEVFDDLRGTGTFVECGILYVRSFSDAMRQLEEYYGEGDIQTIHYMELFDVSVFTFKPEMLETIKAIVEDVFCEGEEPVENEC